MIETILSLGLAFWALSVLVFILLTIEVEKRSTFLIFLTVALYFGGLILFSNRGWTPFDVIACIHTYWLEFILGGVVYFLIGTVWSVVKWWSFVRGERRRYDKVFYAYVKCNELENIPVSEWTKEKVEEFDRELRRTCNYDDQIRVRPQVENFKEEIFLWIGFWPFSALWTIIDDPFKRICTGIYNLIGKQLQAISDNAWKGTK